MNEAEYGVEAEVSAQDRTAPGLDNMLRLHRVGQLIPNYQKHVPGRWCSSPATGECEANPRTISINRGHRRPAGAGTLHGVGLAVAHEALSTVAANLG